ncbi:OmpA family protein [Roseateles violae]|uniref:OmpA family protein n=1 Tax=Roseateles violae TaxID=3058042 RepID=A0ABT8DX86_9BURK|nr:OmpA family protein [Pelomonas sp. PFR6]MDN3921239.1 OmpA family protein [Pelomonas sp. PFR6]
MATNPNAYLDEDEGVALRLVGILVVLVLCLAIGIGVYKSRPAKPPALAGADEVAAIVVENGVVKFFFATASAELAEGADAALSALMQSLAEGRSVVISGYHDASGDAALNADLARRRAEAVRDALLRLGVAEAALALQKPALSTGSGTPREARRVEVLIR